MDMAGNSAESRSAIDRNSTHKTEHAPPKQQYVRIVAGLALVALALQYGLSI
jgi:hypothetical protein